MTDTQSALTRWDMDIIFPGVGSPEFGAATSTLVASIDGLEALFEQHGVGQRPFAVLDDATVTAFEDMLGRFNDLLEQRIVLWSYLHNIISADSRDERAQAALSSLDPQVVRFANLLTRWTAWIGSLDVDALIARSSLAADHAFMLRKARRRADHLMSPAEEALAAELFVTGGSAWEKLYNNYTSQLDVPFEIDGAEQRLPMSAIRNLASERDRPTRERAYHAELRAWKAAETPIAAALNSLKGETLTMARRRRWDSPLDIALFNNHIDRQTLDAMILAMRESFPDFRRYLRAKARALGLPSLAWYDMFAPVGAEQKTWPYEEGAAFITEQFGTFSPKLQHLAERAFAQRWIDVEPRPGKVGGAYCSSARPGESRILMNYQPSFGEVSTLAHELGHAYHNLNLAHRTPFQRDTPMGLAETASIFCETIIRQAAFKDASRAEQLALLDASLEGACQVVVDISSRFLFEQRLFEGRAERELSAEELCQLMLDAQRETYGDGLDAATYHPYMWAAKSHYYGSTFYNFPYTFGLLFSLGLYARYQTEGEPFIAQYDELLSATGLDDASELTRRWGIDIRTPDFWRSSLDIVRADVEQFEQLVDTLC
jgi:oligoendopeptidase F